MFTIYASPIPSLRCEAVRHYSDRVVIELISTTTAAICPLCGKASQRRHSRYHRRLTDLPVLGQTCVWQMEVHKYFCDNEFCKWHIFTKRFIDHIRPYARWLNRCQQQL